MRVIVCILFSVFAATGLHAQNPAMDSLAYRHLFDTGRRVQVIKPITVDTTTKVLVKNDSLPLKKKHDPRKATIRSAILPGWGQIYNREYWKLPLVYAAVGIPIGTYIYNNTWYQRTRLAYNIVVNGLTQDYGQINKQLYYLGQPLDASSLQYLRNEFRRDRDYSILVTVLMWGLQVVDATVFGHLKEFDVTPDLSMKIQPAYDPDMRTAGIGLAFSFK